MPVASASQKLCIEMVCWNCGYFWISDFITCCHDCDSANISTYPLVGKYKIEICLEEEKDENL